MPATLRYRKKLEDLFAAWRIGDALRSAAHFSLDGTYCEAGRPPIVGRDAIVEYFTRFFRDGPRFEFYVDDVLVDGDRAAVRYRFAVVAIGAEWHERSGCAFVAFAGGTIFSWREYEG